MRNPLTEHTLYSTIHNMKTRCYYKGHESYKYYGGRGITVCDLWLDTPQAFIVWGIMNGWKPGLEIDRIDNDGPYSPDNCRFVTHRENVMNSRASKLTTYMVREIKRLLNLGTLTHEHIAFLFKVKRSAITKINCGIRHAEVQPRGTMVPV